MIQGAEKAKSPGARRLRRWGRFVAPAIFVAGLLVTLTTWQANRNDHNDILTGRFSRETDRIAARMAEEVRDLVSLGKAAQAAMGGDVDVDGNLWSRFTSAIDFDHFNPALHAVAYVKRVDEYGKERHRVQFADALFGGEHLSLNNDLLDIPTWRDAANWAAEDGFYFSLDAAESTEAQRLILPIFLTDHAPTSAEERRAVIKGWIVIDFTIAQLFSNVLGQSEGLIRLMIRFENGKSIRLDSSSTDAVTPLAEQLSFYWVGLKARLHFDALPGFERAYMEGDALAIVPLGIAISGLMALAAYQLVSGREDAYRLAHRLNQEARHAAESARVAWQHLSDAIEAIPEGVVLWDAQDRLLLCNTRYREMYSRIADTLVPGVPFEEVARAAFERNQHTIPEDQKGDWVRQRIELHGRSTDAFEQHMSDGRWVLVSERRAQDGGIVGIRADITAIKAAQAQLVQASKLATLGEMATGIAHELNQPLTIMRMAVESTHAALTRRGADGIQMAIEKQEKILRQIERAAAITNQMRVFGRESSETRQSIDLAMVVRETLGMIGEQLRNHGIDIRTKIEPELYVLGNAIRLEQVLLNLLGNARDALEARNKNEPGSMVIEVDAWRNETKGEAELTVADNGGGIDPAILERIFDPFFTTKEPGKGTGLGLSISYGIISEMGGRLTAANGRDGAIFSISMPIAR